MSTNNNQRNLHTSQSRIVRCILMMLYIIVGDRWFTKLISNRSKVIDYGDLEVCHESIIFIVDRLTPRVDKIGSALAESGEKIFVLLRVNAQEQCVTSYEIKRWSCGVIPYCDVVELCSYVLQIKGKVIHYFTEWWLCDNAAVILKHKVFFPPVVIERYDILSELYRKENIFDWICQNTEKYCFKHADGIVYRHSLQYLNGIKYKLVHKQLWFMDYIGNIDTGLNDNELHLVYAGGYESSILRVDRMIRLCVDNHVHYHLYPTLWEDSLLADLIALDRQCVYFHLHRTIDNKQLIKQISMYDYFVTPDMDEKYLTDKYNCRRKIYGGGNKFFDAFAAGLPVVSDWAPIQLGAMSEHGVVLPWDNSHIDFEYLRINRLELKKKVCEERGYWLMSKQIYRLVEFYEEVGQC